MIIAQTDGGMVPIVETDPGQKDRRKGKTLFWKEVRLSQTRRGRSFLAVLSGPVSDRFLSRLRISGRRRERRPRLPGGAQDLGRGAKAGAPVWPSGRCPAGAQPRMPSPQRRLTARPRRGAAIALSPPAVRTCSMTRRWPQTCPSARAKSKARTAMWPNSASNAQAPGGKPSTPDTCWHCASRASTAAGRHIGPA